MARLRPSFVVVTVAALLLQHATSIDGASATRVIVRDTGCKPEAPVAFTLVDSRIQSGVLTFRYSIASQIDANLLETSIDGLGAAVLAHARVAAAGVKRGEAFTGNARVRLPSKSAGGRVIVHANVTFPGQAKGEAPGAAETHAAQFAIEWGNPTSDVSNAVLVSSGGVESLDVPAVRTREGN